MEDLTLVSGYDVKAGNRFRYCGDVYVAIADARGESNAYIHARTEDRDFEGDIIVRHGDRVELLGAKN